MNTPTLETPQLILRKFTLDDLNSLYKIFHDPIGNEFLPWYPVQSIEEMRTFFKNRIEPTYVIDGNYYYAICKKENNIPMGYLTVSAGDSHEMGYALLPQYWHHGFATEACTAVLEQLRQDCIPYVTATHDINNAASGHVLKRLGFKYHYSYEETWQPKNIDVTFRMYQLDLNNPNHNIYQGYLKNHNNHFIEKKI